MIASEDENDTDDAQGSSVASSLPSQTQPTAVLAEEDTEEDLKDECAWYGHSEWFEAAKSNEAKKKGARRTRLQRIKKRCEDEARLRGSTRAAQIAIRRAAAAAPPCGSPPVGANTGTPTTTDLLRGITEQLSSVNLSSNADSGRHNTWKCRLDGLLERRHMWAQPPPPTAPTTGARASRARWQNRSPKMCVCEVRHTRSPYSMYIFARTSGRTP